MHGPSSWAFWDTSRVCTTFYVQSYTLLWTRVKLGYFSAKGIRLILILQYVYYYKSVVIYCNRSYPLSCCRHCRLSTFRSTCVVSTWWSTSNHACGFTGISHPFFRDFLKKRQDGFPQTGDGFIFKLEVGERLFAGSNTQEEEPRAIAKRLRLTCLVSVCLVLSRLSFDGSCLVTDTFVV